MSTQTYYTLLTGYGAAALTNAQASGTTVQIEYLAVGDGNGSPVIPSEDMATLRREVHRVPISSIIVDPDNPRWLVVEAVLPAAIGGWTIREIGLLGGGLLLAVGNFPATYKPQLAEGAAKDLTVRMIVQVSNASVVNLTVDPSVSVVTQKSLAAVLGRYLTREEADARYLQTLPLASTTARGIVELATVAESKAGTDSTRAVTPDGLAAVLSAHAADTDPHPQYLTETELAAYLRRQRGLRYYHANIA